MNARAELWDRVYATSRDYYTQIPGYHDRDARLTADAAADGWFSGGVLRGYRRRTVTGLRRMPYPGTLLNLTPNPGGRFTAVDYVQADGTISGLEVEPDEWPALLWSADLQALFIFPELGAVACDLPPTMREDQLARMWAKGRPASCRGSARYYSGSMLWAFPAIATAYRSDKFTHGRMKEYIHHHGPGVRVFFSSNPMGRTAPAAIMIRGGKLRLTSHGIDG